MRLPAALEAAILAHAQRAAPDECCGLLLGDVERIVDAIPARNRADDPRRRYLIDPSDHFEALHDARRRSLEVVGAYHSHPRSSAVPSATDCAEGFANFIFLIVGLGSIPPDMAAWCWSDGNFTPVPLVRF